MYGVNYKTTACLCQKFVVVTREEKQKEKKSKMKTQQKCQTFPFVVVEAHKGILYLWCKTQKWADCS